MEVRVCKNCRRLFKYIYGPEICPDCSRILTEEKQEPTLSPVIRPLVKEEEIKYEQVRDYIMAHPNTSVAQISEALDIIPTKIFEWIKEDRLEFSDEAEHAWFKCEKCGAKIRSGRVCNRCKIRQ